MMDSISPLRAFLITSFLYAGGWAVGNASAAVLNPSFHEFDEPELKYLDTSRFVENSQGRQLVWGTVAAEFAPFPGLSLTTGFSAAVPAAEEIYAGGDNFRDRTYFERPSGIDLGASLLLAEIGAVSFSATLAANHSWRDIHSGVAAGISNADLDLASEALLIESISLRASVGVGSIHDSGAAEDAGSAGLLRNSLRAAMGVQFEVIPRFKMGAEIIRFAGLDWEPDGQDWSLQAGPTLKYEGERWSLAVLSLPRLWGAREIVTRNEHQNLLALERNRVLFSCVIEHEF
jgi:hypothetical protein